MSENIRREAAEKVFATVCRTLEQKNIPYNDNDDKLSVVSCIKCEGHDIGLIFLVHEAAQVVQLLSLMPFKANADRRIDTALAVSIVNDSLINGSFDYDFAEGRIDFRIASAYVSCEPGTELIDYMIGAVCYAVTSYADNLQKFCTGELNFDIFLEKLREMT